MRIREKFSKSTIIISILFLLFLIWILLQFLAPITLPYKSVNSLDGAVGLINNQEKINNMNAPWSFIYSSGDILCHQKADRSFTINGNQMPFCTRCTAIWLGLSLGLGFMIFYKIDLDEKFIILLFLGLFPIGIDGFGQLFGFWESNNIIRVITGILVGFISGLAIGIILDEFRDIFISWKKNYKSY